ncbi:MAG TPA: TRAP transporter substrate-binding protein DctP [Ramlibacter sp.]|nr:TRAP transporter substrate-binding protein DctP [Ramlibacter sp.]
MNVKQWIRAAGLAAALAGSAWAQQPAWKIGTVVAPPSMLGIIVDEGAAAIGKATGGKVTAERFQNPNEQELTQNIIRGRLEMGYISATGLSVAVPEMGVLNMPFLWRSEDERDFVLDKVAQPMLEQILQSRGLVLVKMGEAGWTNLFCKTACTTPDKMKGMKFRVSPTSGAKLFAERLGVNGAGMSLADFYPALQQGVVDAGDLTFSFYLIGPAAQAAPHYVFTKHNHQPAFFIAHKGTWDKLPPEQQKAIVAALPDPVTSRKRITGDEEPKKAMHKTKGGFIHELSDAQRGEWAKVVEPGLPQLAESFGGRAKELFAAIQKGKQDFAAGKR